MKDFDLTRNENNKVDITNSSKIPDHLYRI